MMNLLGFLRIQQSGSGQENCCLGCYNKPDALWFECIVGGMKKLQVPVKKEQRTKNLKAMDENFYEKTNAGTRLNVVCEKEFVFE